MNEKQWRRRDFDEWTNDSRNGNQLPPIPISFYGEKIINSIEHCLRMEQAMKLKYVNMLNETQREGVEWKKEKL